MSIIKEKGTPIKATATHATAAVASVAAVVNTQYFLTNASASSDKAGSILLIKDGTTVIWQEQVGATFCNLTFDPPIGATLGAQVSVEIDGTAACKANLAGVSIVLPTN